MASSTSRSFHLVNADGFLNVENARLGAVEPSDIDGVLGQSADKSRSASMTPQPSCAASMQPVLTLLLWLCCLPRYFPQFAPTSGAEAEVKEDFQRRMILDFLTLDKDLLSTEFIANKFVGGKPAGKPSIAEDFE